MRGFIFLGLTIAVFGVGADGTIQASEADGKECCEDGRVVSTGTGLLRSDAGLRVSVTVASNPPLHAPVRGRVAVFDAHGALIADKFGALLGPQPLVLVVSRERIAGIEVRAGASARLPQGMGLQVEVKRVPGAGGRPPVEPFGSCTLEAWAGTLEERPDFPPVDCDAPATE